MPQPRRIDHHLMLELWSFRLQAKDISPRLGGVRVQTIIKTVARYRLAGDPRAARRCGGPDSIKCRGRAAP